MRSILESKNSNFSDLFGDKTYTVPKFQRDYSWNEEQWDDLWQDILSIYSGEEIEHYMGYLVLQSRDNKNNFIIDGQQRITTISIIILSCIKIVKNLIDKDNSNEERQKLLHDKFIGYQDYQTLVPQNKLVLNRNSDRFYKQYMVSYQPMPSVKLNSSEKQLKKCSIWFFEKLSQKFNNGVEIAEFIKKITNNLFFTVIRVSDQMNAYKVFETLNARGVQLSSADLLKNYLFQIIDNSSPDSQEINMHAVEISHMEEIWVSIVDKLGEEKFPEFLRKYWNSRNTTARNNNLYKIIKENITTKTQAFALLRNLNNSADIYIALNDPYNELWKTNIEIKNALEELKLFRIKQPIGLLMSAYEKFDEIKFTKVLKAIVNISFRYNTIGGLNPNDQEDKYNKISIEIHSSNTMNWDLLNDLYIKDEQFENNFSIKEIKSDKMAKYILSKIEKHLNHIDLDYESTANTLEHILPKNPDISWQIDEQIVERCKLRIGNYLLLEKKINSNIANKNFTQKLLEYAKSEIPMTKKFYERYKDEEIWGEKEIDNRQKYLAKIAKSIWRVNNIE